MNYNIDEYAEDVVSIIARITDEANIAHPTIVTEAGRAMVAHHAVLVTEVLGVERVGTTGDPDMVTPQDPQPVKDMAEILEWLDEDHVQPAWHDAQESGLQTEFWIDSRAALGITEMVNFSHDDSKWVENLKMFRPGLRRCLKKADIV